MAATVMMKKVEAKTLNIGPSDQVMQVFGKSTIRQSHLNNMRGRYFRDMSIVRADNGDRTVPVPEEKEVVIY
jgi:DNA-binding SARP family transcriptional activator